MRGFSVFFNVPVALDLAALVLILLQISCPLPLVLLSLLIPTYFELLSFHLQFYIYMDSTSGLHEFIFLRYVQVLTFDLKQIANL